YLRKNGPPSMYQAIRSAVARESDLSIGEIVLVPPGAVPKTTSGKVRRNACRIGYLDGTLPVLARSEKEKPDSCIAAFRGDAPAAATLLDGSPEDAGRVAEIEHFIRQQIARFLSCAEYQIPRELSLVELGLDSLKMVELKHRTDALLGI